MECALVGGKLAPCSFLASPAANEGVVQLVSASKVEGKGSSSSIKVPLLTMTTDQFRTSTASRERNRIHARRTRQRKKEQIQNLTERADDLKQEQIRLKQIINEKNTANILVGLFSNASDKSEDDPLVEQLLARPVDEIPDATHVPELSPLILPGQHASKKVRPPTQLPDDGFDYQLLSKDRSTCSQAELDKIRRERNRMHAKRTRDRKRLFLEEMTHVCRTLVQENNTLRKHLHGLDPEHPEGRLETPDLSPVSTASRPKLTPSSLSLGDPFGTLLAVSKVISDTDTLSDSNEPSVKRRRVEVPRSITTSATC